ncbi:ABC transporter [Vibrio rotiferianus]|uniref:ABC transporter ATP-binding protein n=1 Tax=Vibrio rotiferianus TaxID=190895 RepID=UPI001110F484|nr:ABC transporter ATP-binding protein [Vibrio rotiferianus]TMX33701.1 ABC transporter [Vibrio rotiferianus]TMX49284.1 ABC transporter [Vibrio rotiferianus]TMX62669.1 ABC transporter [Vibrio rotiferianus]
MQTPLLKAPIVQANLVSKQVSTNHEHLTILKNVNVDIRKGEKIAVVGTSGAGKSTLMTLLAGLDTPTSGEITLLGHELSKLDDEARAKIRADSLGFVFQSFLLIPSLNALRNVTLPCLLRGEAENDARAKELLTAVGLEQRLTHLPSQLSGGEQQRVALARAFMTQPELLFADEPTGNLDHQTAEKVIELLFDLNEQHGTTLILVTHDSHLASRCDRVYRMEAGELQEETI